jgi:TetR/AcrR family transcriptional regulator, repressor for neighboring sulfatase
MSAESVREALIAATVKLLKRGGVRAVSVRAVAAAAGVNHGLVHRHFGAKEDLVDAAVAWISDEIHRDEGTGAMSASSFVYLHDHPEVARLVARACLDGPERLLSLAAPDPARLDAIVAPIRGALARAGLELVVDAHVVNAFAAAALLGWFAFKPLLKRGFGLPTDADARLLDALHFVDQLVLGQPFKPAKRAR